MRTEKTALARSKPALQDVVAPASPKAPTGPAMQKPKAAATPDAVSTTAPHPGRVLAREYHVKGHLGRPFERTLLAFAGLDAVLRANAPADLLSAKAGLARTQAFRVEGQLRWISAVFPKHFEKRAERAIGLEDILGDSGHAADMLKVAVDTGDKKVIKYWQKQLDVETKKAKKLLRDHWTPGSKHYEVAKLVRDAAEVKWDHVTRDTLIDALVNECDRVVSSDLDMSVLDRLHSLRRRGRWMAIVAQGLDGAVQTSDRSGPAQYAGMVKDPIAKSIFAQLPTNKAEKDPVTIPRTLFLAATKLVDEVGQIKDRGEALEGIAIGLRATRKLSVEQAEVEAARLHRVDLAEHKADIAKAQGLYAQAREIYAEIITDLESQRSVPADKNDKNDKSDKDKKAAA